MRPRVLMLTADFVPGAWSGIGHAVATRARALAAIGVDVDVVLPAGHPAAVYRHSSGVRLHPLDGRRLAVDPGDFDALHLHSLPLAELALQIRHRFDLPLVYTAHSQLRLELEATTLTAVWRRLQETVIEAADHVVVLSRRERASALSHVSAVARRVSVVPHGVPVLPRGRPVPSGPRPVVFVGRFTTSKGIDVVAALTRRLAAVRPDLPVVLAGGHGDAEGSEIVTGLAAEHRSTVATPGWLERSALRRLYARAGVVVVPSRYEPFGMVALEAMAEGAPVLAADVGGLGDIITATSGGALVDSHDPGRWLHEVLALLGDPRRLRTLRRRGPAHVARHHDPLSLATRLRDDVYLPLTSVGKGVSDVA